jgi:hypothetical protein
MRFRIYSGNEKSDEARRTKVDELHGGGD